MTKPGSHTDKDPVGKSVQHGSPLCHTFKLIVIDNAISFFPNNTTSVSADIFIHKIMCIIFFRKNDYDNACATSTRSSLPFQGEESKFEMHAQLRGNRVADLDILHGVLNIIHTGLRVEAVEQVAKIT